jgi:glutamate-1-semialdehyde 2,1-aminomutase
MNAHTNRLMGGVTLARIHAVRAAEEARFVAAHPQSKAIAAEPSGFWNGVPMHWMRDWPMPFPLAVADAQGATLTDADGIRYADFCLGDTGSMFGHSPAPVAAAVKAQAGAGFTHMLPSPHTAEVGRRLVEIFQLPHWQVTLTASDANRFALRAARAVTGRSKILVFNGCYHGIVDETFIRLKDGKAINRPGMVAEWRHLPDHARIVEFNDVEALEAALKNEDVACVITEPVMTNSSMVLPDPGFHAALRAVTRQTGTLLLIDETHTVSSGYGGYSRMHGLEPDLFVIGKAVAGGVPAAVWGMSDDVAGRLADYMDNKEAGHSGMGTTLSANALSMAAMKANLTEVMTRENYIHMERLAALLDAGLSSIITKRALPWHVARVGARIEFIFAPRPLKNGTEAEATHLHDLEAAVHLGLLNRGVLIAPFHNMMLVSPATTESDVAKLVAAFDDVTAALLQPIAND